MDDMAYTLYKYNYNDTPIFTTNDKLIKLNLINVDISRFIAHVTDLEYQDYQDFCSNLKVIFL